MSISKAQRLRLGVFLILGLILLITFAIIPYGFKLRNTTKSFIAYFEGESLSGLEQGATVKFSGVPIGKVSKINYIPNDLQRVKVTMEIQSDFPMKVDMVATTGAMGITGLKYIEITGGTDSATLLKDGEEIETRISPFSTITGKAESIVAKVELLLNHLTEITDPDSLRAVRMILNNVSALSEDVHGFVGDVRPEVGRMTHSLTNLIERTDSIAQNINVLSANLNMSITGERISSTLTSIDSAAVALQNVADNVSLLVRQSREDFTETMINVRQASENADQLTRMLLENPSLLIRSETQKERDF